MASSMATKRSAPLGPTSTTPRGGRRARRVGGMLPKTELAPVFFEMTPADAGLRTSDEYGIRWHYKVAPSACPQDAMIANAREKGHAAFFSREVKIERG